MSIISAVRAYIAQCPFLDTLTGAIKVDLTSDRPGDCGIMPAGSETLDRYMDGSTLKQYRFNLYARRVTEADLERLDNAEFLERFSRWIEDNDRAGRLPELGDSMRAEGLTCSNEILFEFDETASLGTYMVQLALVYERSAT